MDTDEITQSLQKVLNTHGHGFHYSVLKRAAELEKSEVSKWNFRAAEFPVALGKGTRIDLVLQIAWGGERTVFFSENANVLTRRCRTGALRMPPWCIIVGLVPNHVYLSKSSQVSTVSFHALLGVVITSSLHTISLWN